MIQSPIWRDTYYTSNASSLVYEITYQSTTIFSGKAYAMPNSQLKININKVCADYLFQNIEFNAGTQINGNASGTFYLKSNGITLETYVFLYCWDYSFNWTGGSATLSQPICDVYGNGMIVPTTTVSSSSVVSTLISSPAQTDGCIHYGLYYVNRRGGWDAFAIQGNTKVSDKITQYTTDSSFDNTTMEFEANRYLAEIKTNYEFHTHFLSDEQSENLARNLLSTNKLYIHNLYDGTIEPALITDTSVNYQTYQTNGKKLAAYTINAVLSQSRLRR